MRRNRRQFIVNQSIHWSMIGIIFPVLSLAIIEKGLDYFQLGILMAVYSGVTVLLELPTGGLADSVGRKRVYLFSLVASLSGGLSFYLADGFPLMIIAFALMGSGRALSSGSIESLFIDRIYEHDANADIQGTMALVHAAIPVSLGLASLIGGLLPDFFEPMSSAAVFRDRYSANILAFLLIGIIQAGYTIACIEEKPRQKGLRGLSSGFRETPRVIADSFRFGLRNPTILLLLAGGFAWGFSISGLEQFWQPRVGEIGGEGLPSAVFGILGFGYFGAAAVGSLISSPVSKIFARRYRWMLMAVRLGMGVCYLVLVSRTGLGGFALWYFGAFLFNGMANSPEASLMNSQVPADRRSTLLSFASLIMQFGGLSGSLFLGYLANSRSITMAWILAAFVLIASAAFYVFIPRGSIGSSVSNGGEGNNT
jgi:DHA1 family quinolone resistance protein-like MFS transporter